MKKMIFVFLFLLGIRLHTVSAQSLAWTATPGPYAIAVDAFTQSGNTIFAGTAMSLFHSTDNGEHWTETSQLQNIKSLASSGSNIIAITQSVVYYSHDGGSTWMQSASGLPSGGFNSAAFIDSKAYLCTNNGLYISNDNGVTWTVTKAAGTMKASLIAKLASSYILNIETGITTDSIVLSTDNGSTWNPSSGLHAANAFTTAGSDAFAATNFGVYVSHDDGASWTSTSLANTKTLLSIVALTDKILIAGSFDFFGANGVYRTTDGGLSWKQANMGSDVDNVLALFASGTHIFLGAGDGIWRSDNNADLWVNKSIGLTRPGIFSIVSLGSSIFAGTQGHSVYSTSDAGAHWRQAGSGITRGNIFSLLRVGNSLFSATDVLQGLGNGGIFRSNDTGNTWSQLQNGLPAGNMNSLVSIGTQIYAGSDSGIFTSTDNGDHWSKLRPEAIKVLGIIGTTLAAGNANGIIVSMNNGGIWTPANSGLLNKNIHAFASNSLYLFTGTDDGVYRSSDYGTTWTRINSGISNSAVMGLWASNTLLAAGTNDGTYLSTDNGNSWKLQQGLPGGASYYLTNAILYAGTPTGIYAGNLSNMSVQNNSASDGLSLVSSNPNQSGLSVQYSLSASGMVSITLFDLLGRERIVFVHEEKEAGAYSATFTISALPPGSYILTLDSGGKHITKNIIIAN